MGKLTKVILLFICSVFGIILAAVLIIPLIVDLNDYKPEIEAAVKDKTGRTLVIEGDLKVSIFPWLGISTGKMSLRNATESAEENFASIGESDIKVKLMPLFSKKVEVRTVVLKGLELHLAKNSQGTSNWSDLSKQGDSLKEQQEAKTANKEESNIAAYIDSFALGGLVIENSQVSWDDQQTKQNIVVKDINLKSGAIAFNQPIELELSFLLENSEPELSEQLSLSTNLTIDETLKKIKLENFELNSVTKTELMPGGILDAQLLSEIFLDLQQQTLAVKNLKLNTNTIDLTGDINATQLNADIQYTGVIQIKMFNPKELLQQLQMKVPETTDPLVLQKLAMRFNMQGTKNSVALDKLNIALDDTQISGYMHISEFNNPAITFNIDIDDIDIDRYSAPKKEAAPKAAVSTPAKAIKTVTTLIPVDAVRALNLSGDLHIGKLKVAQLKMADVSLSLQAKQGILKTKQNIQHLYKGSYKGQMTINAKSKTPTLAFNEKMANVQIEALLQDLQPGSVVKLKGKANISAKLKARGNTISAIKSTLAGHLIFSLHKGTIRDFNLQKIIDMGKLAIEGKEMKKNYANEQTVFDIIQGTAKIKRGIINNPDFLAESSTVEVKGGGTANLVTDELDYKVVAKMKKGVNKNLNKAADRPVAIKVVGTLSAPVYKVDLTSIKAMLTEKEKEKVDKFIDKREKDIDKALGEGAGKAVNKLLKGFF